MVTILFMKTRLNKGMDRKPTTKAKWYKCIRANTNAIWQKGEHATHQLVSKQLNKSHTIISKVSCHLSPESLLMSQLDLYLALNKLLFKPRTQLIMKHISVFCKKSGKWTIRKMRRRSKRTRQKTPREETFKGNQMTAPRFQTGWWKRTNRQTGSCRPQWKEWIPT